MRRRIVIGLALAFVLPACKSSSTTPDVLPLAPDGVAASLLTSTSALVSWNDLSDNEAGFVVQTSPDMVVWTPIASVGQNVTSTTVTGLEPGLQIHLRVAAQNAKGLAPSLASVTLTPPLPTWSSLANGPASLYWTCSAFDPTRRLMLVYGGIDDTFTQSDKLWSLDLDASPPSWSERVPAMGNTPPTARAGSSLIYDPLGDRLILFGGDVGSGTLNGELWEFRMASNEWFPLTATGSAPSARAHHTAVYDDSLDRMVIFGGADAGGLPSDVRTLSLPAAGTPAWTNFQIGGPAPAPRKHHSAVFDPATRRMVVFAGLDNDLTDGSTQARDIWILDLSNSVPSSWSSPALSGGPPSFRDGAIAAWDSVNGQMLVFGGGDDLATPNDELWILNLAASPNWKLWNAQVPAPGPRQYGTAVFDPLSASMLVFGGTVDDFLTSTNLTHRLGL